jgi:hypothetical protein
MSCLGVLTPPGWQGPADGVPCCWATMDGEWGDCTCWAPIYDTPEQEPLLPGGAEVMPTMCADCAYRPGSPERMGTPDAAADGYDLDDLAIMGERFWCHDGMRRLLGLAHPSGEVWIVESAEDGRAVTHYDPPIDWLGIPHRVDGTPGALCAGWDARRRAWAACPIERDLPSLAEVAP